MIRYFLLATALFLVSFVLGTRIALGVTTEILEELGELLQPVGTLGPIGMFMVIFLNNAAKSLGAVVFGIFFGLPPLLFIGFNGFILGSLVSGLKSFVGYGVIAASLIPHGVIEIPILLLAAALGFTIGGESLKWATVRRSAVRQELWRGLKMYLRWAMPGLAIAAVIEVLVTPFIISLAGG